VQYEVDQGEFVDRRCRLDLAVTREGAIRVGGRVIELGRGTVSI
jgi:trans-2,3-dihydro-3-hydroxyanthranilate isomerase